MRWLVVCLVLLGTGQAEATERIAVVFDGTPSTPGFDVAEIEAQLLDLSGGLSLSLPQDLRFYGNWDAQGVSAALDAAYAAKPDVVLALGILATADTLGRTRVGSPTVAPMALDHELQGLTALSPPRNVYTVELHPTFDRDVRTLREVTGAQQVALLVFQPYLQLLPDDAPVPEGVTMVVPATTDVQATVAAVPDGIDGMLVTGMAQFTTAQRQELAGLLTDRGIATFAAAGQQEVELGFLAGFADGGNRSPLLRRAALLTTEILRGRRPAAAQSVVVDPGDVVLNAATMDRLDLSPPFEVLIQARVVGRNEADQGPMLSMTDAINSAVENSPELQAAALDLQADGQDILRAWSNWMPQLDVGFNGAFVDPNLANASFGTQAPVQVSGQATLTQLIYDEQARVNVPIQRALQDARTAGYVATAQDLAAEVGGAYIDVLRTGVLIEIRRNDLSQVRANLQAARVRVAVGDATTAEVARWESELANARSNLVDAFTQRIGARYRLNQLMGRAPDTDFRVDTSIADDLLTFTDEGPLSPWMNDPAAYDELTDALVTIGLQTSPELRQIDQAKNSQELLRGATLRSYAIPQVAGQVGGTWNAYRTPTDNGALAALLGDSGALPQQPNLYWTGGVSATWSFFPGMSREADLRAARDRAASLGVQRTQVELLLDLRIRRATVQVQGTYRQAHLAGESLAGAERNLDWARDAYGRGLATQVQLLEARSAWLNAQIGEADARYSYAAALVELQRAVAHLPDGLTPSRDLTQRVLALLTDGETP